MVKGTDPPMSDRPLSTQEKTVKTKTKVIRSSMPNPCPTSTSVPSADVPIVPSFVMRPLSNAAPIMAPRHCITTYNKNFMMDNFRVTKKPKDTAGLMCPPLTWAVALTMVATLKPNPRAICTVDPSPEPQILEGAKADPQAMITRNMVPRNSANNEAKNFLLLNSLQPIQSAIVKVTFMQFSLRIIRCPEINKFFPDLVQSFMKMYLFTDIQFSLHCFLHVTQPQSVLTSMRNRVIPSHAE